MNESTVLKWSAINLALLLLFACSPYPRWLLPQGTFQVVFLLTTSLSLYYLSCEDLLVRINPFRYVIAILLLVYIAYYSMPIIHSLILGYLGNGLLFIEILFFSNLVYEKAYKILRKVFLYICVSSLIVFVIHLVGISIPHFSISPDFRYNSIDNYHIYGPCISMYYGSSFRAGIERITGVFAEPGHFGIYLGLIMAINKFQFRTKTDYVYLVTGILTFSTAFYGILTLGIIYRLITSRQNKKDVYILIISLMMILPYALLSQKLYEASIGRVISGREVSSVTSLVENRATKGTVRRYDSFLQYGNSLFGEGENDGDIQFTNWRGGIYTWGYLGISIILLLLLSIARRGGWIYGGLLCAIVILVMSHRMYLIYSLGIMMLVFAAVMVHSSEEFEYIHEQ